ncbi:MAG: PorP/SprF family type IX secretion system membrane protein [Chitinophagales bacterium]|nr:PorP/SprF family type IX secretion system membrane protein [Chitinophagales bacterium]
MKRNSYIAIFVLLLLIISRLSSVRAQDIHFTQFSLQPLQQSPSFVGNFDGNYRIAALYRNQWATIAVPYNSLGLGFDAKLYSTKKFSSFLATGGNFFFDQAGDGRLQSNYLQIPLGYTIYMPLDRNNTIKLGLGAAFGFLNKSLRLDQLQFDNQFNGEVYDPNIAIAENFDQLSFFKPDVSIGYHVGYNFKEKIELGLGFGLHHLNKIEESFLGDGLSIELKKRISLPTYLKYTINKKWQVQFDYLFQEQNVKHEHLFGAVASFYLKNDYPAQTAIEFGSYYRYKDAVSGIIRYRQNNLLVGLSYDVNTSPLRAASSTYGGIELGLVYTIKKLEEPKIKNKRTCFVF